MEKYGLLFESVFKRKLTDEDAVGYLENITKEHPYFSVAQFYLLRLSQKNINGYKTQARKTAVLFNNNHWLNFQLLEAGFENNAAETSNKTTTFPEKIAFNVPTGDSGTANAEEMYPSAQARFDTVTEEEKTVTEDIKIEEEIEAEESGVEEPVVVNEPVIAGDDNTAEDVITDQTAVPEEESPATAPEEKEAATIDEVVVDEPVIPAGETAPGPYAVKNEPADESMEPDEANTILKETAVDAPVSQVPEADKEQTAEPAIPAQEPLLFEPLHTSDYFASVGIKLSEEEKTAGNLGKQLKSFTDWLKTMKKVHAGQLSATSSPSEVNLSAAESSIQKMAEKSNQENDVITEAMAEVLLQQGKADKAVEILEKLSLLNPGKSVYFAAKINQIKEK